MKYWYYGLVWVVVGLGAYASYLALPAKTQWWIVRPLMTFIPIHNPKVVVALVMIIIVGIIVLPKLIQPNVTKEGGIPR